MGSTFPSGASSFLFPVPTLLVSNELVFCGVGSRFGELLHHPSISRPQLTAVGRTGPKHPVSARNEQLVTEIYLWIWVRVPRIEFTRPISSAKRRGMDGVQFDIINIIHQPLTWRDGKCVRFCPTRGLPACLV